MISLRVSPTSNIFASSSKDKTARIWDLRLNNCQGLVHFTNESIVSFDPEGLIFGAACAEEESIKLFDIRSFDKGPFAELEVKNPVKGSNWHEIIFSNDGAVIMLLSDSDYALVLGSLDTGPVQVLTGIENPEVRLYKILVLLLLWLFSEEEYRWNFDSWRKVCGCWIWWKEFESL